MFITHEEARQLIQFNADQALPAPKRELLELHLKDCIDCTNYRQDIDAVKDTIQTTMRKHWSAQVRHLNVQVIREKLQPVSLFSNFLPMRGVLVGMMVVLFVVASWQFVNSNNKPAMLVTSLSPIPTPSLLLTGTNSNLNGCQKIQYEVQQGDTLENLAKQFSTSREILIQVNNLQSATIQSGMKLIVPDCDPTPTQTTRTPTLTITPMLEPIIYTPG